MRSSIAGELLVPQFIRLARHKARPQPRGPLRSKQRGSEVGVLVGQPKDQVIPDLHLTP